MISETQDKQRSIAISVGVNAAAELSAGGSDPINTFVENVDAVVAATLRSYEAFAVNDGTSAVVTAFPGTTVVQPAVQQVQQVQQQYTPAAAAAPVAAPPPAIPGASSGASGKSDALWNEFFQNPNAFYDNRTSKTNPNAPDFSKKGVERGGGLWLYGKWPAPEWVFARLAQMGI
jgi:hypothetical protein